VEALALGMVLALTGLLASTGTATDPAFRAAPAPSSGTVGREVADLQVGLGLSPNQPGRTVALVEVYDTRRPAPAPVTGVDVALGTGLPVPAAPLGEGRWSAPLSTARPGSVTLRVAVHRPGLPDTRTSLRWTVGGGPARHPVVVSQAPLRGLLLLVAAALAAILAAGWAAVAVHRSRTRHPADLQGTPVQGRARVERT
jgi:copper transport protein